MRTIVVLSHDLSTLSTRTAWSVVVVVIRIALGVAVAVSSAVAAAVQQRPNVLFLFSDDQRADTIGALGNPVIKTPNLDALVRRGFVMRNAYCLGSNLPAVCTPSRNMLLSGRAYFRWAGPLASGSEPNFPDSMHAAGYETYHHGKPLNTATEIQKKFDHNKYVVEKADRASGEPCQAIVDDAISFLKTRRADKPFFMYLAFSHPHDPRIAAEKYLTLYRREQIPMPKNYLPVHPFDNGEMTVRDERLAPWPRTEAEVRRHLHEYYAVISGMDFHLGRLLRSLGQLGLEENTIIIYSSDHGLAIGSHGLMGKQNLYEHSMKVPLIFAGPGIPRGESDALTYLIDIYPTVCDLSGASAPDGLDGRSFAGILRGQSTRPRDTLFLAYRNVQRAIRDERWKLIRYPEINQTQLFDLSVDPDEVRDLANEASHAPHIKLMLASLRGWQDRLGDTTALSADKPKNAAFQPPDKTK